MLRTRSWHTPSQNTMRAVAATAAAVAADDDEDVPEKEEADKENEPEVANACRAGARTTADLVVRGELAGTSAAITSSSGGSARRPKGFPGANRGSAQIPGRRLGQAGSFRPAQASERIRS